MKLIKILLTFLVLVFLQSFDDAEARGRFGHETKSKESERSVVARNEERAAFEQYLGALPTQELGFARKGDHFSACMLGSYDKEVSYQQMINAAVELQSKEQNVNLDGVWTDTYWGKEDKKTKVSIISQQMCEPPKSWADPDSKYYDGYRFIMEYNRLHHLSNTSVVTTKEEKAGYKENMKRLWENFMGCLSLRESLGDADSYNPSKKGPRGDYYEDLELLFDVPSRTNFSNKHPGVKHYYDPGNKKGKKKVGGNTFYTSSYNFGLYQMTPDAKGNIKPCIKRWNKLFANRSTKSRNPRYRPSSTSKRFPGIGSTSKKYIQKSCAIPENDDKEAFRAVSSSSQAFNAFCGANKIVQTFYVQMATDGEGKSTVTASSNKSKNNNIDGKEDSRSARCVNLFERSAYQHFGPIRSFSEGRRADSLKLMACAAKDIREIEAKKAKPVVPPDPKPEDIVMGPEDEVPSEAAKNVFYPRLSDDELKAMEEADSGKYVLPKAGIVALPDDEPILDVNDPAVRAAEEND